MSELITRIDRAIAERKLLKAGELVLVAVSGGVDSMVLLHVLHTLSAKQGWNLVVAHLNHCLRGRAADLDEQFVARCAMKLGLRFESARIDVKKLARTRKISLEMAARQSRHDFLAQTARALGIRKIALAHHADDQVELFFLRLFRGAGPQGLGGMEWTARSPAHAQVRLVRPLLNVAKAELAACARARKILFREDRSNRSTEILRNRVRHKLLPFLRKEFQPLIGNNVLRSMGLLRDAWDWLTHEALHCLETPRLARSFAKFHVALQRQIVQLQLLKIGVAPRFELIEALRAEPAQWVSVDSSSLCRRRNDGTLETRNSSQLRFQTNQKRLELNEGGGQILFDGIRVAWHFKLRKNVAARVDQREFFDARALGKRVVLRHWQSGDRFRPIGMEHTVKLQDWFVNQKIPRECRHKLMLATTEGGEIFWVEGLRIGERFKVTPSTKRQLEWRWNRQ